MSEEEIIKQYTNGIVNADKVIKSLIDKFKTDKTSVDIQQLQLIAEYLLYKVDKLQKENEDMREELQMYVDTPINKLIAKNKQLKEELEKANKQLDLDYVDNNFISKDEIKQLIGYEENEDVSKDERISLLRTMWEEFNRLENLEDFMATQCISKKKIRNKIKEVAEEPQIYVDTEKFDKEFEKSNYIIEVLKELLGE